MQLSNSLTPRSISSSGYLLRQYGGAAAAYSLQRLDTSVENVVRARRSTDDAEADFTAQEVSGGSLREFALNNDADLIRFADQASATDKRMYFDGVNDYVNLTGQYGSAGRIELKVVLPAAQSRFTKVIGNRTTASVDGIFLQIDDVAGLIIKAYVNNSSTLQTPALSVGQEHEIALAWGSGSVELFLDGVSVGTDTYTGAITPQNFLLGYFAGPYFKGLIYDVRHYSDAAGTTLVNSYNGYGNTNGDWEDQVGSNDGTVVGAPALFSGQGFDAYVTTLYDQSGNGRDATQSTAASQPQIVADGVVVTDGSGNWCVDFNGSNNFLNLPNNSMGAGTAPMMAFAFYKNDNLSSRHSLFSAGDNASATDAMVVQSPNAGLVNTEIGICFTGRNPSSASTDWECILMGNTTLGFYAENGGTVTSFTLNNSISKSGLYCGIGATIEPAGNYFDGKLHSFFIYHETPTTQRFSDIYNAVKSGIGSGLGLP